MRVVFAVGLLLGNLTLGISLRAEEPAVSSEPTVITVTLGSGRTLAGVPDQRSSEERLWLRSGHGSLSIARPIEWSAITAMSQDEAALTVAEALKLAELDNGHMPLANSVRQIEPGLIVVVNPLPTQASTAAGASIPQVQSIPTSLRIDAAVDNFDGDTENDGLVVELRVLDQRGNPIPFDGTARIRWVGPQARKNTAQSPPRGIVLGDWTVPVTSDGNSRPVQVTLPFQVRNPERDVTLWNYSLVEVTLNVPGVGNFAAERDGVRIRRWEPYRDFNQVHTNGPIVTRSSRRP